MAESTSYSSSSTGFAADTETVVSDCEGRDSGEEAGSWSQHKGFIIVRSAEITYLGRDSMEEKNQS